MTYNDYNYYNYYNYYNHYNDPHDPGSLRSRVSRDLEQDRSQLKCDRCNNRLTDLDWSKIKSNGWDAEIVELAPFCSNCIDQWRVL